MKYYYDITLNFNELPINFYEWEKSDDIERILKIKVYKVNDLKDYIGYNIEIDLEDDKYVLCDGINSIAIEVINGKVAYLSYLTYEDEINVCQMVRKMTVTNISYKKLTKRKIIHDLRWTLIVKNCLLAALKENNEYLLRYMYLQITNKDSKDIEKIKKFLIQDINSNLNDKYIDLYRKIIKGHENITGKMIIDVTNDIDSEFIKCYINVERK